MKTALREAHWEIDQLSRNVHRISIDFPSLKQEQWVLLMSDAHWDNPKCDRALMAAHLGEAMERRAPVLDAGDFFCAMQGKFDKRSSKSDLREEHKEGNYLDRLVETGAEWLGQYRDIITVRGQGNHETAILKNHETNLVERLVERMRADGAPNVFAGGFSGYVIFSLTYNQTKRHSFRLWYHHGYGGGGPVTRGTIQTNRQAVYIADADIIWNGHIHEHWLFPIERIHLSQRLRVERTRQLHIRSAGYKDEFFDGFGGWHMERGGPPKPLGSVWLRFFVNRDGRPDFEALEAR